MTAKDANGNQIRNSHFLDLVEGRGELTLDEKCDGPPFRDRSKYPKEIQEFFWPDDGTHEWWVRAVHNDQIFAAFYRGQRALLRDRREETGSGRARPDERAG